MEVKVSVIVPVYNGEKTIKNCIESLVNQTLEEIEIIVINDGSNDNTLEVLNGFSDGRLKIISIKNSGQGNARNRGLKEATGKYIGFADADDSVSLDMFKTMYEYGEKTNADVVQCAINDIKNGVSSVRPEMQGEFVEITDTKKYVNEYFCGLLHTNEVCNKIFKRDFLIENDIFFADTREIYSEDLKLNIDILEKLKRVYFLSEPFYNYNISDSGHLKKSPEERLLKIFRLYNRAIKDIRDKEVAGAVKSTAVITLLSYCVDLIDTKSAKTVIQSKEMHNYFVASMLHKRTLKHILLMISLLISPFCLKKRIIQRKYNF